MEIPYIVRFKGNTMKFLFNKGIWTIVLWSVSCTSTETNIPEKHSNKKMHEEFSLKSCLNALYVGDNYVLCDTNNKQEESCFFDYGGRRFVKKAKQFFDSSGNINHVIEYKPEGILRYEKKELLADSMLLSFNSWKSTGNMVTIKGDSVLYPVKSKIEKATKEEKKIYCLQKHDNKNELIVFEIW